MSGTLDPLTVPLRGLHLIEASAGTGKTYAIAHLVLRLVAEVGLPVERVLVLTFTEAATEELRGRIARRLREALEVLRGVPSRDGLLTDWASACHQLELARTRLEAALAGLDRAAIQTIHGFCQRLLRDFAFESGAPFDAELITDEQDLRRAAAEDFWRRRMAAADRAEAAWLLQELPKGPDSLLDRLGPYLGPAEPRVTALDREGLADGLADLTRIHGRLREAWGEARAEVSDLLLNAPSLTLTSYKPVQVTEALAGLDALCSGPAAWELPARFQLFTPAKLKASTKKGGTTPGHPFFALCGELMELDLQGLARTRRADLLADALDFLRGELRRRKQERRLTYFDDLLRDATEALGAPQGQLLAVAIRERFPQALVDEFQDTDRLQYAILKAIYWNHLGSDPGLGLYLIGDPKQAIYGFRGADIFTYIEARRDTRHQGELHTLDTNRRSASGLVEAVNRLFGRARAPFIFVNDIDFRPVKAGPEADLETLQIGGLQATPLVVRWLSLAQGQTTRDGRRLVADSARDLAVADCARQVADLLAGPARLGDREFRASDIAVLVRSHREGLAIREGLAQVGVGSVTIGQETVFQTEESEDLAALIKALEPGSGDGTLRAALATRCLGWTADELAVLEGTDSGESGAWDQMLRDFYSYRRLWQERGFMAAMAALIHGLGVPARLRRGPEGERRLTNLLHLVELAQAAAREHPGPEAVGRWLADRRARPEGGDAALLRLESDENLVQVVTFHKSKGLEYPVVFIPFPWSGGPRPSPGEPVAFHDPESLEARLDLGSADLERHQGLRDREDLAERLRLLYVALTRAKRQCTLYWGPVNQAEGSAAAYLLHQEMDPAMDPEMAEEPAERMRRLDEPGLRADLEALARAAPGAIAVVDLAAQDGGRRGPGRPPKAHLAPAHFGGTVPQDWRLLSFSALTSGPGSGLGPGGPGAGGTEVRPDHDAATAPTRPESLDWVPAAEESGWIDTASPPAAEAAPLIEPIFRFPRGVRAGHCLHDLFEHLDFRDAEGPVLVEAVQSALARHGLETHWTPTLVELAERVLDTQLTPEGLRLRGLGPEDRRSELEFHFALGGVAPAALWRVLGDHGFPTRTAATGGRWKGRLEGLMKGFIDLVLRFDGRFYVVDYKSNHLGDQVDDYRPIQLARAMAEHDYHLQSLIYTLALHRYLRARLPTYDPGRHLGGSLYLFLRGMRPDRGPDRGVFHARPARSLIDALDRVLGPAEGARR